jgi:hypothetical protein
MMCPLRAICFCCGCKMLVFHEPQSLVQTCNFELKGWGHEMYQAILCHYRSGHSASFIEWGS